MAKKNNDKRLNDLVDPAQGSEVWRERWTLARTNQDRMFKRYADWYDSLYAQIGRVPSPWRSKVYAPVLAKQAWNLLAKFLTIKPGFEVEVKDDSLEPDEATRRAEMMQHKLDFDWDNNYFDDTMKDKLFGPMLDAIVTGTGMFKVNWNVCTEKKFSRLKDAYDTIDLNKHQVKEITHGFNDIIPVNAFGIFVSPSAKNLYNAPWIIIREYKPIAELEAVNEAEGRKVYQNLDILNGKVVYDTYAAYDRSRNRLLANADPTDKTVRMVALYECYEKSSNMIYTYAETGNTGDGKDKESQGWVLLRKTENPYWHGKYPLVKVHLKKKAFNFWGEGIFEINYRLQSAYNDIINHYIDAANVAFDPMLLAPEDANVDDYVIQPAGLVQYQGSIAPVPFKHLAPTPEQLQTPLSLFDQLIEGTTMPNYATGIADDKSDNTKGTATGILRLQQAASDIVTFFRGNYMQSMTTLGKMWMSNNQQFMLRPVSVTLKKTGRPVVKIKPEDLQGDMDLTIDESSIEPLTSEDKITVFNQYTAQLVGLQNQSMVQNKAIGTDPIAVDYNKLGQDLSEQYRMMDFSKIVIPKEDLDKIKQEQMKQAAEHVAMIQQQQQQAQSQQQQGQQHQPKSLFEDLKITMKDLPEDVQKQLIYQIFGIMSTEPTPGEKELMLKGMDTVSKAAGKGHDIQMDKVNMAHTVAQSDQQNQMQQQQAMQQTMQPQGGAINGQANTGAPAPTGQAGTPNPELQ